MKSITLFSLLIISTVLLCENENSNESKNGYQPFPHGGFFFSNNNSQSFNLEETNREVQVHVKKKPSKYLSKPKYQNPQPPYQPVVHQPEQPTPAEPTVFATKTKDYVSYYSTHLKSAPQKFLTLKNAAFVAGILFCSYAVLYYKLMKHVKNAKKTTGWGSFQEHIPPLQLSTIQPLILADGIIEEIKNRYPLLNPSNLMPSLLLFNKDVEQELEELQNFIQFYTWLEKYKVASLFPDQRKLVEKAQNKIQRLFLLRDAIAEWIHAHVTRLMRNQPIPRKTTLTEISESSLPA